MRLLPGRTSSPCRRGGDHGGAGVALTLSFPLRGRRAERAAHRYARDDEHRRLQAKIGELLNTELLYAKVDQLEAGGTFGPAEVDAMMAPRRSPPVRRTSGSAACGTALAPGVCAAAGDTVSCTVSSADGPIDAAPDRPGGPHSLGARSEFMARATEEGWAKLRVERCAPRRSGSECGTRTPSPAARGPRAWADGSRWDHHHRGARRDVGHRHDGHRDGPEQLPSSSWPSITARPHASGSMPPSNPLRGPGAIRQGLRERFGGIGDGVARGLRLRHDHGSNYLADDFQQEGRCLRHRKLPELRAGARRPRRRGALHPHAEGESVVGAELRDDRGAPPGLARVQADVQRAVDARSTTTEARPRCDADLLGLDAAA